MARKERMNITLTPEVKDKLTKESEKLGLSRSQYLALLINNVNLTKGVQ